MTNRMIMSPNDGLTFMYRVRGIAVHDGHQLVERNVMHGFCFVPGGRGSKILDWDGVSEGTNREPRSSGHHWTRWEKANLLPAFLRERVRAIPQTPEYVVSDF